MRLHIRLHTRTVVLLQLIALAYLGLYLWGLLTGMFTPSEIWVLTVVAVVLLVGLVAEAVVAHRTETEGDEHELRRANARLRETRGF